MRNTDESEISMCFSCFSYLPIDFLYVFWGYYTAVVSCRITYIDVHSLFSLLRVDEIHTKQTLKTLKSAANPAMVFCEAKIDRFLF